MVVTINIGLTGWSDHPTLYTDPTRARNKLVTYSSYFPVVEIDTSFYAIPLEKNYQKWVRDTPDNFSFVINANQSMTGHDRKKYTNEEAKQLFQLYRSSIQPVLEAKKLTAILFQFPPWFDVNKANIQKLRKIKEWFPDLPLAIEFRNQSWFTPEHRKKTLDFLKQEGWIHSICDEPQAGEGSVPMVLEATDANQTLIRFHGRNVHGWNRNGQENWREVRFLYDYNLQELEEWVQNLRKLEKQTKQITILFNNNSGGHAANNALTLIRLLEIQYKGLHPQQMDLFDL
ncbi:DUF72 domain-containing protein [Radiobacillus sp. PE A8.2]|uniref:DUF72 domain-containing protein n=1 Tax=Radiobacillus sp. PE A8.2 TaxID=3380349 RepID=UPI00388FFF30